MFYATPALAATDSTEVLMWLGVHPGAFLAIVALLIAWLWLRLRRPGPVHRHASRPTPITIEELGRTLLRVARGHDYATFQALFLSGHEAQAILGESAIAYFEARDPATIRRCLDRIFEGIPASSVYDGVQATGPDQYSLRVSNDNGAVILVPIGTVVQVGAAWRMFCPDTTPPATRPGAPRPPG